MTSEPQPNSGEEFEVPEVSVDGLRSVLEFGRQSDAKLVGLEDDYRAASMVSPSADARQIAADISKLDIELATTAAVLDMVLPRPDMTSWREQMHPDEQPDADPDVGSGEPRAGESPYIDRG